MTKETWDIIMIIVGIAFVVLAIIFGPLVILWALNQLFPVLAIPYNFWNWLAVVVLNLTWMSKGLVVKKD
jgi:hypothetical protein